MNLSSQEILIVALLALIVLGPTRLPEAARQVGKAMRTLRSVSFDVSSELRHALEDADEAAAAADASSQTRPEPPRSTVEPRRGANPPTSVDTGSADDTGSGDDTGPEMVFDSNPELRPFQASHKPSAAPLPDEPDPEDSGSEGSGGETSQRPPGP